MSLTRFLPTPSDRMGILWTLLQIDGLLVLEYGTAGTTAYAARLLASMGQDVSERLYTTEMGEHELVMGDTTRLEDKIRELDTKHRPQAIAVMASSVSAVTGADVKGVCHYMQGEIRAHLLCFSQGGFGDDFSHGLRAAYSSLVEQAATEQLALTDSYNILGASALSHFTPHDLVILTRLMGEYTDLHPHATLAWRSSWESLRQLSQARLNLVISHEALPAAQALQARFGTPYVYGLPMGESATAAWRREIESALGLPLSPAPRVTEAKPHGAAVIYAEYDNALALRALLHGMGYEIKRVLCTHQLPEQAESGVDYLEHEREKLEYFASLRDTLILGDQHLARQSDVSNRVVTVSSLLYDPAAPQSSLLGEDAKHLGFLRSRP